MVEQPTRVVTDLAARALEAFRVDGKRIWVTGASKGLGFAIARGLVDAGARVAATSRSAASLGELTMDSRIDEQRLLLLPGSVCRSDEVSAIAEEIDRRWGGLDVLVNCAGITGDRLRSETLDDDTWNSVLDVNLTGTFLCARAAARMMLREEGGSIINVSSIHGIAGISKLASYSASKGGCEALTRSLAIEWAQRGVRVNALAPGYFITDMTQGLRDHDAMRDRLLAKIPQRRFGDPAEIVPAVIFLASDASKYVTGATLLVDGGWTAE